MANVIQKYRSANLGWLYYKQYYESTEQVEDKNETILKRKFAAITESAFRVSECKTKKLTIAYPGLLIGSGYILKTVSDNNDAFKVGFFFDHVTGMPCIPGHSVKGLLRSAFPHHKIEKYPAEKTEMISRYFERDKNKRTTILKPLFEKYMLSCKISEAAYTEKRFIELLGNIIFEGQRPRSFEKSKDEFLFEQIPIYERDIFHDAYVAQGGKENCFLGTDYITPHAGNPLKNPIPIKFLKILPEVKINFQFDVKHELIEPEMKLDLFERILKDFGIGAKTNVGYGQFVEVKVGTRTV